MFGGRGDEQPSQAKIALQALSQPEVPELNIIEPAAGIEILNRPEPILVLPEGGGEFFEAALEEQSVQQIIKPTSMVEPEVVSGNPKIAIIMDDIGMDIGGSEAAVNLPEPITIAILPYAERARDFAAKAKNNGQELIIHAPMEAMSSDVSLGDMGLTTSDTQIEFDAALESILNSFEGYVGMNNHMGSKLTQDTVAMTRIMEKLKERGLFFVDSRTIHTSVAAETAAVAKVPFATRNVFLDHEDTPEFVSQALEKLERIAKEQGSAIAIGHPKDNTIAALQSWIPDAKARGFEFVPVSALVKQPSDQNLGLTDSTLAPKQSLPPG